MGLYRVVFPGIVNGDTGSLYHTSYTDHIGLCGMISGLGFRGSYEFWLVASLQTQAGGIYAY